MSLHIAFPRVTFFMVRETKYTQPDANKSIPAFFAFEHAHVWSDCSRVGGAPYLLTPSTAEVNGVALQRF